MIRTLSPIQFSSFHVSKFGAAVLIAVSTASASANDPLSNLIRRQTDVTSEASSKGDQAIVDKMTADEILFSAGDGNIQKDDAYDLRDKLSKHLEALTADRYAAAPVAKQAPSSASLFVTESGNVSHDSDFEGGSGVVTDWVLHRHGNVAVSGFTVTSNRGRFLGVEIWTTRQSGWKLVGGQTIPLYDDPPGVELPAAKLEEYVGTYSAGPGSRLSIQLTKDGLIVSQPKSPTRPLRALAEDIFYTSSTPAGFTRATTTFRRDDLGEIRSFSKNGIIFSKVKDIDVQPGDDPILGPLEIQRFQLLHVGNLAIATFIHSRESNYYGQTLHQTFRSMESWIEEGGRWKMISSQGRQL